MGHEVEMILVTDILVEVKIYFMYEESEFENCIMKNRAVQPNYRGSRDHSQMSLFIRTLKVLV